MDYTISIPFKGSVNSAMEAARSYFMASGFKLDQPRENELIALGQRMYSTKQGPISGVSRARISVSSNSIEISAELGGVKFMKQFLYLFPPALAGFLALIFIFIPGVPGYAPLIAALPVLPWVVLSPLMAGWIRNRTIQALDTLAHNMAGTMKS